MYSAKLGFAICHIDPCFLKSFPLVLNVKGHTRTQFVDSKRCSFPMYFVGCLSQYEQKKRGLLKSRIRINVFNAFFEQRCSVIATYTSGFAG